MTEREREYPFSRTELLLGKEAMDRLAASRVAVFGLGGVGGYAVEALARSGVGTLDLIDRDTVSLTNLNRQILATCPALGRSKAEVAAERVAAINPAAVVHSYPLFYTPETAEEFDLSCYDYIVDAIDTVSCKLELIVRAKALGVPIISAMGAGNKLDPTAFEVADIFETSVCPLARVMRAQLRKRKISSLKVVYSREQPIVPPEAEAGENIDGERRRVVGSIAFVPSVAGLILAGEVIRDLAAGPAAR